MSNLRDRLYLHGVWGGGLVIRCQCGLTAGLDFRLLCYGQAVELAGDLLTFVVGVREAWLIFNDRLILGRGNIRSLRGVFHRFGPGFVHR